MNAPCLPFALPRSVLAMAVLLAPVAATARGVTPYLPLNLSPDIERKVEQVLILAGQPVMRRPIPAALVLDALPAACRVDRALCADVRAVLDLFIRDRGITLARAEAAIAGGDSDRPLPNAHARPADSLWQVAAAGFYQPNDHVLLTAGGVAYDGRVTATGTMASAGFEYAQLDIGFRDHWFSPLTDSSLLISTEAPTLPSVTVSNYTPFSPLGITYEVFAAELSRQQDIRYFDTFTSGNPRVTGLQVGVSPGAGYALTLNRIMQYGGGARGGGGLSDLWEALVDRSAANQPDSEASEEFGNQVASLAASLAVPGAVPLAVRLEYAGEDSSYGGNYRFGDTAVSLGIDLPRLGDRYDASVEVTEWQNAWYVHHLYPRGLTHKGFVLGHWFGDQRQFGDQVGGWSVSLAAGLRTAAGNQWRARYRTLDFVPAPGLQRQPAYPYRQMHEATVQYHSRWQGFPVSVEVAAGRDAFGDAYGRLGATFDAALRAESRGFAASGARGADAGTTGLHVSVGATYHRVFEILSAATPDAWTPSRTGLHVAAGVRRPWTRNSELGIGLEADDIDGRLMLSLRALDYRYRVTQHVAVGGFLGVGRYDWDAPAHGWYFGAGVHWRDVLPHWDVGIEGRYYDKLSRNRIVPGDPVAVIDRPRLHFDVEAVTLALTRRF